jgi:branched-chain amino acid transport system ATP-binding protein
VSFQISKGEVAAILGRNGAGKTTTLKAILGLVRAFEGRVIFDGHDITGLAPYRRAMLGIGYVPQDRHLFQGLTVMENLEAVMRDPSDRSALTEVLELFPALKTRLHRVAGTLSGGEQQMVAIARALVTRPKLVLMDEATMGLMPSVVTLLRDRVVELNQRGVSFLLVEEKVPFALSVAQRVYFLEQGQIAYASDSAALRGDTDVFMRYLGVRAQG